MIGHILFSAFACRTNIITLLVISGLGERPNPFLPSCAKLLYFVDFCVTGSVFLLLCVAAGHGRKINQGRTLLD